MMIIFFQTKKKKKFKHEAKSSPSFFPIHVFLFFLCLEETIYFLKCIYFSKCKDTNIHTIPTQLNRMFKKLTKQDIKGESPMKSSFSRNLKQELLNKYPNMTAEQLDEILPKKKPISLIKCEDRLSLYACDSQILFAQFYTDEYIPHLKFVHKFPRECFKSLQVDKGAIKFILGGSDIMCPGITSKGGVIPSDDVKVGDLVFVYAEGKESALCVGKLKMSGEDIKTQNKGIAVEVIHYLGDGLWNMKV